MKDNQLKDLFFSAQNDFSLISKGDKVLVGVSGNKESMTLLHFLTVLRDSMEGTFDIIAAHVKFTNLQIDVDIEYVQRFCKGHNVDFFIIEDVIRNGHMKSGTCIHCSRFRRAKLMDAARTHNCNKLALGHNLDDIIATLLMNMTQHARYSGMAVKIKLKVGDEKYPLTIIRPMCYISEKDIYDFVIEQEYKSFVCFCPIKVPGYREKVREAIECLCNGDDNVRMNIFRAQFNIIANENSFIHEELPVMDIEDIGKDSELCVKKRNRKKA